MVRVDNVKHYASVRYQLLGLVLIPLILLGSTVIFLAYKWSSNFTYEQLFAKVNADLSVARDGFASIEANGRQQLLALANSARLRNAIRSDNVVRLNELLAVERALGEFNFLNLIAGNGKGILDDTGWQPYSPDESTLATQVLAARTPTTISGIEIVTVDQWQQQSELDEVLVVLALLDTERAAPSGREVENRAMIMRTVQSVYDAKGNRVAILEAGLLLNRNFTFVDRIRDLVYGPGSLPPGSRGTVTVFLDDVRITTNVLLANNRRALGTRVSQEVLDAVLGRGETWIDRAFVVDDWYISGYEPIVDVAGERVGMLYAGYLEAPFRAELIKAIATLSALVLTGCLAASAAAMLGARTIFARLQQSIELLQQTRQRLATAEKLAALGELTAGVAHEINNPTAVILGNMDVLVADLGERGREVQTETDLIIEQVYRIRSITDRLLQYSRSTQQAHAEGDPVDADGMLQWDQDTSDRIAVSPGALINETLTLLSHELEGRQIDVHVHDNASLCVLIDRQEFQQVLINLVSNAIEAIGRDGVITVTADDASDSFVNLCVADTGAGIEPAHLPRLFDPFFTAGKAQGTGLGLSVSYGIVRRYGGDISVYSVPGTGSRFTLRMPAI